MPDVDVPTEYVNDGFITLNISSSAVLHLELDNDFVSFEARFSGRSRQVYFPIQAVVALFARENGEGITFPEEDDPNPPEPSAESDNHPTSPSGDKPNKPFLKIVK